MYKFLGFNEKILFKVIKNELQYPPLFIVGPPRSGTTALFLYLVNTYQFSYFPNVSKYHPDAPISYFLLYRFIKPYIPTFENKYGIVDQPMAPSDGWNIFLKWFEYGYQESLKNEKNIYELRQLMGAFERLMSGPFCVRNNVNSLRIRFLNKIFPDSLFVAIYRDYREAALSLLKAYKAHNTPDDKWWSAGPPDYDFTKFEDQLEKAVFQVLGVEAIMKRDLELIGGSRKLIIDYDSFCKNPQKVRLWVKQTYEKHGVVLKERGFFEDIDSMVKKSNRSRNEIRALKDKFHLYYSRFIKGEYLLSDKILTTEVRRLVQPDSGVC